METGTQNDELFDDLSARAEVLLELDGPQVEAWVSGLFGVLDDQDTLRAFVDHCAARATSVDALLLHTIAELASGLDGTITDRAAEAVDATQLPEVATQIGQSALTAAWQVEAPFGTSIVLGFEPLVSPAPESADTEDDVDLQHAVLVELEPDGSLEDIQLAGSPANLLEEAAQSDERITFAPIDVADALGRVIAGWPSGDEPEPVAGPGIVSNQQFVRRRILAASETVLPAIKASSETVDTRRGLDDTEFADANRAALSTLRAALGDPAEAAPDTGSVSPPAFDAWVGVVRGDGGELSARERDALLWLEWADWLGVGIGLVRAGTGTEVSGELFIDLVNRCPEVSSTIDKADREYAAWAFEVAIDLLDDAGAVAEGRLTASGFATLHPAMISAWTP